MESYFLLERLSEKKFTIGNYCLETSNLSVLDANKWNLKGKLVNLLKIFNKITMKLSHRNCTASEIIPQIRFLQLFLSKAETKGKFGGLVGTAAALKTATQRFFYLHQ